MEEVQKFLMRQGVSGKADANHFLQICLDYQNAKVMRLPNILMGVPAPNVSEKEAAVKSTAKNLLEKYPNAPQEFLTQVHSMPELVLKALNEIMWINL